MSTKDKKENLLDNIKYKFESVQRFLQTIIKENSKKLSNLSETNYKLGLFHLRANNLRDAEFRFRIVLYFIPDHYLALYNLAKCYIAKKQRSSAIEKIKLALKIKPDFSEAEYLLGTLEKSKKIDEIPLPIIEDYYDNIAPSYNERFNSGMGYRVPQYMADLLSIHFEQRRGNPKILDLGCGTGKCTEAIIYNIQYEKIVGIDISKNMLKEAQKIKNGDSPLFDKLVNVDFNQYLDKTSSKFDIVLAGMSLHFKKDLQTQLQKISRVLEKNACIAFTTQKKKESYHSDINISYEYFEYTISYIKEAIKNASLTLVTIDETQLDNGKTTLVCICKK